MNKKFLMKIDISFPPNSNIYKDSGFQGYEPEGTITYQPKKKPKGGELTAGDKTLNSIIYSTRVVVEPVISGIKMCLLVKNVFRNTKEEFNDIVMEIACGLHNFRNKSRSSAKPENLLPIFS